MTDDIYQRYIFAASRHSGKHMNKLIGWVFNHDTKEFERDDNLSLQLIEIAVLLLSFGMIFIVLIVSLYNLWSAFKKVELNIISRTLLSDPEVLKDLRTLKHLEDDKNYTNGMGIMGKRRKYIYYRTYFLIFTDNSFFFSFFFFPFF